MKGNYKGVYLENLKREANSDWWKVQELEKI
jgi:hypothetical protein